MGAHAPSSRHEVVLVSRALGTNHCNGFLKCHNSVTVLPVEDADLLTDAIMDALDDPTQMDTDPSLQVFEQAEVVDNYERKLK